MRVEARGIRDLEPRELRGPVDRTVVVGAHHVGRHRLAKATRATHADALLLRVDDGVEVAQQSALVDVDPRVSPLAEHGSPGVEIDAHVRLLTRQSHSIIRVAYFAALYRQHPHDPAFNTKEAAAPNTLKLTKRGLACQVPAPSNTQAEAKQLDDLLDPAIHAIRHDRGPTKHVARLH